MRSRHHLLAAFFLFLASASLHPAIIIVPDDFVEIQDAIDASANGDTIIVRPGTYVENINFLGKAITLKSEAGAEFTIIDGGQPANPDYGSVVIFENGEGLDSVLDGFTLRNGTGTLRWYDKYGGGILGDNDSAPMIMNNIISNNTAASGGGVEIRGNGTPMLLRNQIVDNVCFVHSGGGAVINGGDAVIESNLIARNEAMARNGGGILIGYGSARVSGNIIRDNVAFSEGGGILCTGNNTAEITENLIIGNTANAGGGIVCDTASTPTISGNFICDNRAFYGGGGIYCYRTEVHDIVNNVIANNWAGNMGGGVASMNRLDLINCTIVGNTAERVGGGVVCCGGDAILLNSIIWDNHALEGPSIAMKWAASHPSNLNIDYTNVQGGMDNAYVEPGCNLIGGQGIIDADPLFHGAERGYYFLRQPPDQWDADNPCVDAGDPNSPLIYGTTQTAGGSDRDIIDLGYHYPFENIRKVPERYTTIQEAIDACEEGDLVSVRHGTYVEKLDFRGKEIWVKSRGRVEDTIIDGNQEGTVVMFRSGETGRSVLEGFTITNGLGQDYLLGGGIQCDHSSPVIIENVIIGNESYDGAGIRCWHASPEIIGNTLEQNTAKDQGGGIYCDFSEPVIKSNEIKDNSATWGGGGIATFASFPVIENNTIIANDSFAYGGGIKVVHGNGTIRFNTILDNSSRHGGGLNLGGLCSMTISNNIVCGNTASDGDSGGAISCSNCSMTFRDNITCDNVAEGDGGAFCCEYGNDIKLVNNTIANNSANDRGGAIYTSYYTVLEITNTILWNNSAPWGKEIFLGEKYGHGSHMRIGYSVLDGGGSSVIVVGSGSADFLEGNITADPLFVNAASGDYHIHFDSPCRNAGANNVPGISELDFEGDPRIAGGVADMGGDEFHLHLYHVGEVLPGGLIRLKVAGKPGAQFWIFMGPGVRTEPLETQFGMLHLEQPTQILVQGVIPPDGIWFVDNNVPSFWISGRRLPLQALSGGKLSNLHVLVVE